MTDPDQIRAEIEVTRQSLSSDVNALTDRANPANAAKRQVGKARTAAVGVKDKVMGSAQNASSHASSAGSSVSDSVTGAPDAVSAHTRGNPLAAGLIAFGGGLLLGSLLPASQKETEAAASVKANASTLAQPVTEAAKGIAQDLKEPAQEALESVKSTATDAAATVKDEGASSAQDVKGDALDAKDAVQDARN
jgi:ElaB/YqjD/DUF883 family membrane-anchored ribosome-binding protein